LLFDLQTYILNFTEVTSTFTMDKTLEAQFQRVEKALATLIASISTYNPNPGFAQDLVNADAELSHGLADCEFCLPSAFYPSSYACPRRIYPIAPIS
jgi:hypothetical protein